MSENSNNTGSGNAPQRGDDGRRELIHLMEHQALFADLEEDEEDPDFELAMDEDNDEDFDFYGGENFDDYGDEEGEDDEYDEDDPMEIALASPRIYFAGGGGGISNAQRLIEQFHHLARPVQNLSPEQVRANIKQLGDDQRQSLMKKIRMGELGGMGARFNSRNFLDTPRTVNEMLLKRKLDPYYTPGVEMSKHFLPSHAGSSAQFYYDAVYSGQFSKDGSLFYNCCKDMKVRVYDTSDPYHPKQRRTLDTIGHGQYTLTDCTMSSDNSLVAFSTMARFVTMQSINDDEVSQLMNVGKEYERFAVFSVEFSADDSHILAACGDNTIKTVNVETPSELRVVGKHEEDVNVARFIDSMRPDLLASGSDDTRLMVWDLRTHRRTPVGVFLGHTEGITGLDSRDDGIYLVSNGKDQVAKLWDMRTMLSPKDADSKYGQYTTGFDYRWDSYGGPHLTRHPADGSVMTYGGHSVMRTLVRCHFSPEKSTGRQYVYSGSADGSVYIWNVDGTLARTLTPSESLRADHALNRAPPRSGRHESSHRVSISTIRDVSWHPTAPVMYASGAIQGGGALSLWLGMDDVVGGAMLVMPYTYPTLDMNKHPDYKPSTEYYQV